MNDKLKKITLRSKIFAIIAVLVVAVTCIAVLFPLAIDPSTFTDPQKRSQWIVNTIIIAGLATIGMTLFETIASDILKGKEGGKYKKAELEYLAQREKIRPMDREFPRWMKEYDRKALREKEIRFLISKRFERPEVYIDHLEEINPYLLADHQEKDGHGEWTDVKGKAFIAKDGTPIATLEPDQAQALADIKEGKVGINPYPANYYLTIDSVALNVAEVDKADCLMRAKKENQNFSRIFRIVKVLLASALMAMVTVKDFNNLGNAEAWYMLISRLCTFGSGVVAGWMSADTDTKFDTDLMNTRTAILTRFQKDLESGDYKPMTYEERARKEAENDRGRETAETELPHVVYSEGYARESDSPRVDGKPDTSVSVQRV